MNEVPVGDGVVCSLHRLHAPKPMTVELHHIVPVAWQLTWQPSQAPFPGRDPDGRGMLWDARTVATCPTGHRSIHFWIVKLMKAAATISDPTSQADLIDKALKQAAPRKQTADFKTALLALDRFVEVFGDLHLLTAAGQWGQS